jgi:Caspase domain
MSVRACLFIGTLLAVAISSPQYANAQVNAADDPLRHGHALLIGVSNYTDSHWPVLGDIKLQMEQLKIGLARNFDDVQVLPNPSFDELDSGLRKFLRQHGNDDGARLFIYYSGHGYTETDLRRNEFRGYITGADTPFPDGSSSGYANARVKAISMEAVRGLVSDINAQQVLIVFDSCFSGTVFSVRSPSENQKLTQSEIAKLLRLPVREFISAGDENEKIPAHSPIPQLFLNAIAGDADTYHLGVVTAQQIADYLWVKTRQTGISPRAGKLPGGVYDRGEFVFRVGLSKDPMVISEDYSSLVPSLGERTCGDAAFSAEIVSRSVNIRLTSCVMKLKDFYTYSYVVENRSGTDIEVKWDQGGFSSWIPAHNSVSSKRPSLQPPEENLTDLEFGNLGETARLKMITPRASKR